MNNVIEINGRKIGKKFSPYVVAEISANHNGNIENALRSISEAKICGAHAVKLQSYTADTMTIPCDKPDFQITSGLWKGQTLHELYRSAQTPFEWHKPLFDHARKIGITCFSTPFDETAVDLLENLNACAYKIASFELTDLPLVKYVASTGKPMIVSTGMANFEEINDVVSQIKSCGNKNLILLHCVSSYPAPITSMNIKTISKIENDFGSLVGLSDHSLGVNASLAATALGACFIEKHFILDRTMGGPDSSFSIEPDELKFLCEQVDLTWQCLGESGYQLKKEEQENIRYRRSLYAVEKIKKGEPIRARSIRRIRPGYGLSPKHIDKVLTMTAGEDIEYGEAITWSKLK